MGSEARCRDSLFGGPGGPWGEPPEAAQVIGLASTVLALLFTFVNVEGAIVGLVHLARSPHSAVVPHELIDAVDPGDHPGDPTDDSDGGDDDRSSSPSFDEDDVKHVAPYVVLRIGSSPPRLVGHGDDPFVRELLEVAGLDRPPRAYGPAQS